MHGLSFVSGQGVRVLWVLGDLGYVCRSEWWGCGDWKMLAGKGGSRKGLYGPFVQESEGCVDRVLKDFFNYHI